MTIDRIILGTIAILLVVTFGEVLRENLRSEIYCVVKYNTLICPQGTMWKYKSFERPWEAINP